MNSSFANSFVKYLVCKYTHNIKFLSTSLSLISVRQSSVATRNWHRTPCPVQQDLLECRRDRIPPGYQRGSRIDWFQNRLVLEWTGSRTDWFQKLASVILNIIKPAIHPRIWRILSYTKVSKYFFLHAFLSTFYFKIVPKC